MDIKFTKERYEKQVRVIEDCARLDAARAIWEHVKDLMERYWDYCGPEEFAALKTVLAKLDAYENALGALGCRLGHRTDRMERIPRVKEVWLTSGGSVMGNVRE